MYVCWIHGPSKNYILGTRHLCLDLSFSFLAFSFGAESLYSLNFGFHICKMNTHYYLPGFFGGFMINKLLEIFVYTCCLQLLTSHSLLTHPIRLCPHHTIKTALVRVIHDLHIAESNGQITVFILLDLLTEFIRLLVPPSSIEFLHICSKNHIFMAFLVLHFLFLLSEGMLFALICPSLVPDLSVLEGFRAQSLVIFFVYIHSVAVDTTSDDYQICIC